MVNKQSPSSSPSNYRTRSSLGIRPKKRQSYGDFIEHPIAKRRISAPTTNLQKKVEKHSSISGLNEPEEGKESNAIILKECQVVLQRMPLVRPEVMKVEGLMPVVIIQKEEIPNKKVLVKKCSFPNCTNVKQEELYDLPRDTRMRDKWLKLLRKKFTQGMVVCSKHFNDNDFIQSTEEGGGAMPTLKEGSLPKKIINKPTPKKYSPGSIRSILDELLEKKLINDDNYKQLEPFRDLTKKDLEQSLSDEGTNNNNKSKVKSLVEVVGTNCSKEAQDFLRKSAGVSLGDQGMVDESCSSDYAAILKDLFPVVKDKDIIIRTSVDVVRVLIEAKLILEEVEALVESSACLSLSSLEADRDNDRRGDGIVKSKMEKFSKIVFLNSPEAYNKIRVPLHLPTVSSLFPSLSPSESEDQVESMTLGQLLNEASRFISMSPESIKSLIPFGGCQLCPYSLSTLGMYKHVISSVFFNARMFFNFLAEYLPLPSILLFAKSPLSKECDSTADQVDPKSMAAEGSQQVSEPPTSSTKKSTITPTKEKKTAVRPTSAALDVSASNEGGGKDDFTRCVCQKTGKNIAKLDVDTVGFLPKDLNVKVVGHVLTITGFKEDNGQKIDFLKTILLPNYVDADQAGCYYFKGKMSIHAPVLENVAESDDHLSSITTATNSECSIGRDRVDLMNDTEEEISKVDEGTNPKSPRKRSSKSVAQLLKPSLASNDDDLPRNVAVLMNVDGQEYVSLIAEVSKLFKPSEITVKVRENKIISVKGETKSSDPLSKSRLHALVEREFDLPKKIDKNTLKAGCPGDGLLKIFAKVALDQNGH